jgi:hypothetical protein
LSSRGALLDVSLAPFGTSFLSRRAVAKRLCSGSADREGSEQLVTLMGDDLQDMRKNLFTPNCLIKLECKFSN